MTIATEHETAAPTPADTVEPTESPDLPAAVRRHHRPSRTTTALTALAVVLALLAAGLLLGWRHSAKQVDAMRHQEALRSTALAAAQTYAVDLTTYDYAQLAAQQAKLAGESTAAFQATFANSMKTLGPIFQQLHATATGKVVDVAVVDATDKQATVIAFVDQTASSKQMTKPEAQSSRVKLTLVRKAGAWLLDRVDLV